MSRKSLEIALSHYYWKPGKAFFHALEIDVYRRAGIQLEHPAIDIGCGDGTFNRMLVEGGLLSREVIGLDLSACDIMRRRNGSRNLAIMADARALPIKCSSRRSVLANGLVSSVPADMDRVLGEAYRILQDNGLLVMTVPTPIVNRTQLLPRLLSALGMNGLSKRSLSKLNARFELHQIFSEQDWRNHLERASFRPEQALYYFTPQQAFWANLFSMQIFRFFSLLRFLHIRWFKRLIVRTQIALMQPLFEQKFLVPAISNSERGGWLLIVARKRGRAKYST